MGKSRDQPPQRLYMDATSQWVTAMASSEGDLHAEADAIIAMVRESAFPQPARCIPLDPSMSEKYLLRYAVALEEQLAAALRGDSWHYWSHIARRIGPRKYPDEERADAAIRYLTLHLACLKFGSDDLSDIAQTPTPGGEGADGRGARSGSRLASLVSRGGEPNSMARSEYRGLMVAHHLARELMWVYAGLRSAGKGAPLRIDARGEYYLDMSEDLRAMVRLYDDRRFERRLSLFGPAGLHVDLDVNTEGPVALVPQVNVDEVRWGLDFPTDKDDEVSVEMAGGAPNFLPAVVGLEEFAADADLFDDALRCRFGVTTDEVVGTLHALTVALLIGSRRNIEWRLHVFQRGWLCFAEASPLIDLLADLYTELPAGVGLQPSEARAAIVRVFECFGEHRCSDIDLRRTGPVPLLRRLNGGVIIDLWLIPHFLNDMLVCLPWCIMGEEGQQRGARFEQRLQALLTSRGCRLWECGKRLKKTAGDEREIDVSLIKAETLFVVECKSAIVPPALNKGDRDEVEHRLRDVVGCKLDQCDSLRAFIASDPRGRNYEVPGDVRRMISLACAPYPEFLPHRDDYYFLADGTPRFVTPKELVDLLSRYRPEEHIGRRYWTEIR